MSSRKAFVDVARPDSPVALVTGASSGIGADIVLECSGAPSAVDDALHMAKRSGLRRSRTSLRTTPSW